MKLVELLVRTLRLPPSDITLEQVIATVASHLEMLSGEVWFKRIWTLQEAVLATDDRIFILQAGREWCTWYDLCLGYEATDELSTGDVCADMSGTIPALSTLMALRMLHNRPELFSGRLCWTCASERLAREASDDRDYVYGQIGLFNAKAMDYLKYDYADEVECVFMAGSLALIKAGNSLDALSKCCAGYKRGRFRLPSCCRDWSDGSSGCGLQDDGEAWNSFCGYNAASTCGFQVTFDARSTAISLRGMIIDEIMTCVCGSPAGDDNDLHDYWDIISDAFLFRTAMPHSESRRKALCQTFINGTFDARYRAKHTGISQAQKWLENLGNGKATDPNQRYELQQEDGFDVQRTMEQIATGANGLRSMFETTGHRFGRSCSHVRRGDKVCVLLGGRLPFVLREAGTIDFTYDDGNMIQRQAYQLIGGECYVHGPVDGEAQELVDKGECHVGEICII